MVGGGALFTSGPDCGSVDPRAPAEALGEVDFLPGNKPSGLLEGKVSSAGASWALRASADLAPPGHLQGPLSSWPSAFTCMTLEAQGLHCWSSDG